MNKYFAPVSTAVSAALFAYVVFCLWTAPTEPPADWVTTISQTQHDVIVAQINHHYTVAAYAITWVIQLGYVAWLALRWRAQKRASSSTQPYNG
jgi:hypothetical protein